MKAQNVVAMPVAPFLVEMHSERLIDLMIALGDAGFKLTCVAGSRNRYRIDDSDEPGDVHGRR